MYIYIAVSKEFWKTEAKRNLDIGIHMEDGKKICKHLENISFNYGSWK